VTIDLAGKTSFADLMVIATGSSQRHRDHRRHLLTPQAPGLAGDAEGPVLGWVLIDAATSSSPFQDECVTSTIWKLWGAALPESSSEIAADGGRRAAGRQHAVTIAAVGRDRRADAGTVRRLLLPWPVRLREVPAPATARPASPRREAARLSAPFPGAVLIALDETGVMTRRWRPGSRRGSGRGAPGSRF
jgi:hypothetical protein